jgi:hypothetical protein
LPRGKCLLSRRFPYLPAYTHGGTIDPSIIKGRTKIFYAGELRRPVDIHNLKEALNAVKDVPEAFVYVCGMGGQWLTQLQQKNVVYLGVLDYRDFDTVAGMCDFGLIIYPRGPYYDITPTGKYSAYVANGLAVLSANPPAVAACIEEDGVGVSVPIDMIPSVLRKWVDDPAEFSAYRQAAARVSADFHSGLHLREWFNEVKHIARSKA